MPRKLIIVGGGEHARVIAEMAESRRDLWDVEGFVAPERTTEEENKMQIRRLGTDRDLPEFLERDTARFVVLGVGAVGNAALRREIVKRIGVAEGRWASVIDTSAHVSPSARIGNGVVVMPGALINAGAMLGDHSVVNTGAIIEHDVAIGAFAQVAPGAVIGGAAVVGPGAFIGLGARVRDHVSVGAGALVGMGAAVVRDVSAGTTVVGMPARVQELRVQER